MALRVRGLQAQVNAGLAEMVEAGLVMQGVGRNTPGGGWLLHSPALQCRVGASLRMP